MTPLFAFISPTTAIILGVIGVLIFGRRLPEIARFLGKSVIEFKKGVHGLESGFDDFGSAGSPVSTSPQQPSPSQADVIRPPQRVAPAAPKFDDNPPPITPK